MVEMEEMRKKNNNKKDDDEGRRERHIENRFGGALEYSLSDSHR